MRILKLFCVLLVCTVTIGNFTVNAESSHSIKEHYNSACETEKNLEKGKPFDFGADMEGELRRISNEKLNLNIENYQYLAISDALTDSNYKNTVPAQILCTVFMELEKDEYLPYGIFYNENTAYMFQRTSEDSHKLVEYNILTNTPASFINNTGSDSMYASIPYEITNILTW